MSSTTRFPWHWRATTPDPTPSCVGCRDEPLDSDIWIENIPYNETRGLRSAHSLAQPLVHVAASPLHAQQTDSWLTPIRPMRHTEQSDRIANSDR